MPEYPKINDKDYDLLKKIAENTADIAAGGSGGGGVSSVNGETGVVVLDASDVGAIGPGYTPAVPANWPDPDPTTIAGALDSAAASLVGKLPYAGDAFIVVKTTNNAVTNGTNLLAAYAAASALTPNGLALSAVNRSVVIMPPGRYDLGALSLETDTEFVDIFGLAKEAKNVFITSLLTGINKGTILQTALDVCYSNFTVQSKAPRDNDDDTDIAAYWPDDQDVTTVFDNVVFDDFAGVGYGMRQAFGMSAIFRRCVAPDYSFGTRGGTFQGVAELCVAGDNSFGHNNDCSGTLTECVSGDNSFGFDSTCSATLVDCIGGASCFGGGTNGVFSGRAANCISGIDSFGYSDFSGKAFNCTGGNNCFGTSVSLSGEVRGCIAGNDSFGGFFTGKAWDCVAGTNSFGRSIPSGSTGIFGGYAYNCVAGANSFGQAAFVGDAFNCSGGNNSFGGASGGTFAGWCEGCSAGNGSYGGNSGIFAGFLKNCRFSKTVGVECDWTQAWSFAFFGGKVSGCVIAPAGTNLNAMTIPDGSSGQLEFCTFRKTGSGVPLALASGAATLSISFCKFNTVTGYDAGITNNLGVLATSFNIGDTDV